MASYSTVKYGSRGEDVIALQMALNNAGYELDTDGIFGTKTQEAVRDYQASKGLTVDGIVGANTWGALNSSIASSAGGSLNSAESQSALTAQLESLIAQFNSTPGYTPKTDEQIREQAEGEYQSYYDQLKLTAQQQQEQSDLALSQQRDKLATTYQKQKEASAKEYADAYSTTDRQLLSRGMQRSSYAAQTLANIDTQGAQAQQAIADAQAAAEGDIDAQRTQLAQQLAAQLAQYDASKAADVLNRIRELEDQEYERTQASQDRQNSLSMQIYELMYQQERDRIADEQWQQEFEESVRQFNVSASKKSSSSGSKSSGNTNTNTDATANSGGVNGMSYTEMMNMLNGGASAASSAASSLGSALTSVGGAIGSFLNNALNSSGSSTQEKKKDTTGVTMKQISGTKYS